MVCADAAQSPRGVARRKEDGCRHEGGERERRRGEDDGAPPQRNRDRGLGRLCELRLAPDGWERGRQPVGRGLVQADGAVEVLQPLLTEVAEEDVQVFLLVLEQRLRRLRDQDLPPVPSGADPGCAVDGETCVTAAGRGSLAGMQSHSHLDLNALRPGMGE